MVSLEGEKGAPVGWDVCLCTPHLMGVTRREVWLEIPWGQFEISRSLKKRYRW